MTPPLDLAAAHELIAVLLARIEEQAAQIAVLTAQNTKLMTRVADLEAKLGLPPKGPDNSSVPPSRGQKPSGSAKAKAKRNPHGGAHRTLHPNPTSKRDVFAAACSGCGADFSGIAQKVREVYDRIEIPKVEPDVTRVTLHGGVCPCCAKTFKAEPPEGLEPGSPFGPNLRALAIYLRAVQGIPLARLKDVLFDLFGLEISEGALVNILRASRPSFSEQTARIKQDLFEGRALASDETGLRVGKKNWWLWVFHHARSAIFLVDRHRSKAVVGGFLGDWRPDNWLSDRYCGQLGWATTAHQFCLAHVIRDAQYAIDSGDHVFAPKLQALLKQACAIGRRRKNLSDGTLKAYENKLLRHLADLMELTPICEAGRNLRHVITKIRRHLFVFITRRDLEATNNESERSLRPCAVYRKITNGFRSEWGAHHYADIRSTVETGRRRAVRAIDAIRMTLNGQRIPMPP